MIISGTLKGEDEVGRRRGGKKIEWTGMNLPVQLGQLKTGLSRRDCCKVIYGNPTTFQGYGIDLRGGIKKF